MSEAHQIDPQMPPFPNEAQGEPGRVHEAPHTSDGTVIRPVPRVTIQAFCETPDVGVSLQRAAQDRRLAKAHLTVHMGGILSAISHYSDTPTPGLIIVESALGGQQLLDSLDRLAEVCDAGTRIVVVGHANDISLYRELIRKGVNDYLVAPLHPISIVESISTLYADPEAPPLGRTIAFTGARGGTGSSTIAHNAGWCISEHMNEDVTIVDLDLAFGTGGLDFNQDPAQGVADALYAPERLDDVLLERLLVRCTEHLSLFAAPATLDRDYAIDNDTFEVVLDVVRHSVPCVVLDLPHVWGPWTRKLLLEADEIVITATPDLASLRNTKNLLDMLSAARPNDVTPHLVINQVGVAKRPEIPIKDFAEALGSDPALVLPFDAALFGEAANNGQMIEEIDARSKTAQGMRHLASVVSGRPISARAAVGGSLLSRLLGRKG
ncbi:CpaE family protein [Pyruvatibacter sp.]|uniref:CpaE family protein n=1 Tax=Pyruvatibacter sp. TaxID=1981328 RepID=UPI0032EB2F76